MVEVVARLRGWPSLARLKRQGLSVGHNVNIRPRVSIDFVYASLITIGNDVTISEGAHILAHDASMAQSAGVARIGSVVIEDGVFIGRGAVVLPGVRIGARAVVGANAVVARDIPAGVVAAGVPATVVVSAEEWGRRHRLDSAKTGAAAWDLQLRLVAGDVSSQTELRQLVAAGTSYIEALPGVDDHSGHPH